MKVLMRSVKNKETNRYTKEYRLIIFDIEFSIPIWLGKILKGR